MHHKVSVYIILLESVKYFNQIICIYSLLIIMSYVIYNLFTHSCQISILDENENMFINSTVNHCLS